MNSEITQFDIIQSQLLDYRYHKLNNVYSDEYFICMLTIVSLFVVFLRVPSWSYDSLIFNYMCNQYLSLLK